MKSKSDYSVLKMLLFVFLLPIFFQACSPKVGCPAASEATAGTVNRKGELSTKGGNSQLFGKSVNRRKMQKRRAKQRRKLYGNRRN